ncbi:MAG: lytic transglycosylase domain-containing protein [Desulfobulbaceae bacterium]|nr:lytic transglycosylase domain-containing protein [Desulfobulbaceae bacterium]
MIARSFLLVCAILLCLLTAPPRLSAASTIELPLTLRTALLQHSIARYLNPLNDKPTVLYQEGPYRYLHSDQPRLYIRDRQPHFSSRILARLGFKFLGIWPVALNWNGSIDMTLSPYVDAQWQLRYHIVDSVISDNAGTKPMITGLVWKLVKHYLHPRLENFSLDLQPPQQEIVAFLRACASPAEMDQLDATLNSIVAGPLRSDVNGIVVPLMLTVPDRPLAAEMPLAAEAPLDSAELESFEKVLEPWDAFLVFVIKSAGADFVDTKMREQLFDLLLTSRYQLLPILAGEVSLAAGDPLRNLFVDAWHQLRLIIEEAEDRDLIQGQPLRYMTFVNAGDALLTLDAAAPRLGMQITTDGLRRLARTLQPGGTADPLYFDWEVDPALRELFQFAPEPAPEPAQEPAPESAPAEPPPSLSRRLLDFLLPMVYADEAQRSRSLNRWVPRSEELEEYRQQIGSLLQSAADEEISRSKLDPKYTEIFQHLVPATALIESCWRQFVDEGGQVTYLRSTAGSIGLMQINQHVWRGFYNLDRLRWEVPYNIRAGSQILMRYLTQYGMAVAAKNGDPGYAPRSTYSVYNAGPRAARRFMKKDSTSREKRVDEKFWTIYQGIEAGGKVDLSTCDIDIFQAP